MTSKKQIQANRRNAKLSPGPKTERGKSTSSMNALKTGAFAKSALLRDEDPRELSRLRRELYEEWRPVGPTEKWHLERLVTLAWRQIRLCKAESGLYDMFRRCPKGM